MKLLYLSLMLTLLQTAAFAQQTQPLPLTPMEGYLQKSKNQKTSAWLLAGGGSAVIIGALLSTAGIYINAPRPPFPKTTALIGGACIAGSVPLFVAASKNKKRARTAIALSQIQTVAPFIYTPIAASPYPAVAVKVNL